MAKNKKKRWHVSKRQKPGSIPGTIHVNKNAHQTKISITYYNKDTIEELSFNDLKTNIDSKIKDGIFWINIAGLKNKDRILEIAKIFHLHDLALEDIYQSYQRPKVEPYEKQLFFTSRLFHLKPKLNHEQISFFVGSNYVITVQEKDEDCFDPIRIRLKNSGGRIRTKRSDYLAYSLIDTIVDSYFPLLEYYGEELEELENSILRSPTTEHIALLHEIKTDLIRIRRSIWPQRESLQQLMREDSPFINQNTHVYFRDALDHSTQMIDLLENFREMSSSLLEVHLSTTSNKLNEVMKVLTMISTIFIPLSFLAGIYGMNFSHEASNLNMPELHWKWGYPVLLSFMVALTIGMLFYFKKMGWIFTKNKP